MIRFLVRAVGYLCLAGAFVGAVIDGTRSIASGNLLYGRVADTVASLDPALQARLVAWAPGWLSAGFHDWGGTMLLQVPLTLALLVLALLLLRLGTSAGPEVGIRTR